MLEVDALLKICRKNYASLNGEVGNKIIGGTRHGLRRIRTGHSLPKRVSIPETYLIVVTDLAKGSNITVLRTLVAISKFAGGYRCTAGASP